MHDEARPLMLLGSVQQGLEYMPMDAEDEGRHEAHYDHHPKHGIPGHQMQVLLADALLLAGAGNGVKRRHGVAGVNPRGGVKCNGTNGVY